MIRRSIKLQKKLYEEPALKLGVLISNIKTMQRFNTKWIDTKCQQKTIQVFINKILSKKGLKMPVKNDIRARYLKILYLFLVKKYIKN